MSLYVYRHCPFCVRVELVKNFTKARLNVKVLLNDDEATPIKLVGKKMVPILERDGKAQGESLDIAAILNAEAPVESQLLPKIEQHAQIEASLAKLFPNASYLLYPRFINKNPAFDEFATQEAKDYFINKKSAWLNKSFTEMEQLTPDAILAVENVLAELTVLPLPSQNANKLSWTDVVAFPPLRNLTLVKGIKWPENVQLYLDEVSKIADLPLYEGF